MAIPQRLVPLRLPQIVFHACPHESFQRGLVNRVFDSGEIATLSAKLPEFVSAVHAYEVTEALTYVKDGKVLPHYQA